MKRHHLKQTVSRFKFAWKRRALKKSHTNLVNQGKETGEKSRNPLMQIPMPGSKNDE